MTNNQNDRQCAGWAVRRGLLLALTLVATMAALGHAQARPARDDSSQPASPTEVSSANVTVTPASSTVATSTPPAVVWSEPSEVPDFDEQRALPAADGSGRGVHVPILMYHYISDPPKGADRVRRDLSLPGTDFELQLRYLVNEGYHSVSLRDLAMHIQRGTALPEKPIVLTFDDGYKDAYTVAFPLLQKYGFSGTFFIFSKPINEENRDYLSWREVELMSAAGMEFGSHSYSHPDLRGKPADFVAREVVDSRTTIEQHIGQPVRFFCYPSGSFDKKVERAVREAGYWGAVTIRQGTDHSSDTLWQLTRIRVRGPDGLERFDALLNLDW